MWHFDKCRLIRACTVPFFSLETQNGVQLAYAQAGLSICWSHIPQCSKYYVVAHIDASRIYTCMQGGNVDASFSP